MNRDDEQFFHKHKYHFNGPMRCVKGPGIGPWADELDREEEEIGYQANQIMRGEFCEYCGKQFYGGVKRKRGYKVKRNMNYYLLCEDCFKLTKEELGFE